MSLKINIIVCGKCSVGQQILMCEGPVDRGMNNCNFVIA